jgi:hypothetical protein
MYFFDQGLRYFSIIPLSPHKVQFVGMSINRDYAALKTFRDLKLTVDGKIEINTDGKIIQHNASSAPWLFGLMGGYTWHINSFDNPTPVMIIQLN